MTLADDRLFAACGLIPAVDGAPFSVVGARKDASSGVHSFKLRKVNPRALPRGVAVDLALEGPQRVTVTISGPARGVRRLIARVHPELLSALRCLRRVRRRRLRRVMRGCSHG